VQKQRVQKYIDGLHQGAQIDIKDKQQADTSAGEAKPAETAPAKTDETAGE
jgi:hypothetical protein